MTNNVNDRELLLGVLAVQFGTISREQLTSALQETKGPPVRKLLEVLRERYALTADVVELLSAVADRQQTPDDAHCVTKSWTVPTADIETSDPHATISYLANQHRASDESIAPPTDDESGNRFRVLRPHAKGGLGEVFVAQDLELDREVALKEIQARFANDQSSRTRFVLEAEITGSLEHPGIVPVYGLGQYSDGRPFYAMRFVRGETLKEAAGRFHEQQLAGQTPEAGSPYQAVEFRKLLGRFVDVCQAIAYAHSRGILHRDLKPGNIMLGKYGETLVVDWGLAKVQGRTESARYNLDEATLRPASAGNSSATLAGSAIGTPAYMSPEQAAGRLDELGPAADVYSLGATLYHVLTGKPPFGHDSLSIVLSKVQSGDFPRPREVARHCPQALEAICLKAMALQQGNRYPGPAALADDVERWLADDAVTAFAEPATLRVQRWTRKHPRLVAGGIVSLLASLVCVAVVAIVVMQANVRETAARDRVERLLFSSQVQTAYREWKMSHAREAETALKRVARNRFEAALVAGLIEHNSQVLISGDNAKLGKNPVFAPEAELLALQNEHSISILSFPQLQLVAKADLLSSADALENEEVTWGDAMMFSGDGSRLFVQTQAVSRVITRTETGSSSSSNIRRGTIRVFDSQTGKQVARVAHLDGLQIWKWAASRDGKLLFVATPERAVVIDVLQDKTLFQLKEKNDRPAAFSPAADLIATSFYRDQEEGIAILNSRTGEVVHELPAVPDRVSSLRFDSDGQRVIAACGHNVAMWSLRDGSFQRPYVFPHGHEDGGQLDVAPEGGQMLAVSEFHNQEFFTVLQWKMESGWKPHFTGATRSKSRWAHFTKDSQQIVSCDDNGEVSIVPAKPRPLHISSYDGSAPFLIGGDLHYVDDSLEEPKVATAHTAKGVLRGVVVAKNDLTKSGKVFEARMSATLVGAFGQEQALILGIDEKQEISMSGGLRFKGDGSIALIDARTQKVRRLPTNYISLQACEADLTGRLLAIVADKKLFVWDAQAEDFTVEHSLADYSSVKSIAFDASGKRILLGVFSNTECVAFDLSKRTSAAIKVSGQDDQASVIACHPRVDTVAVADGARIRVRDSHTFQIIQELPELPRPITRLAFSPDGETLVSGGEDGSLTFWDQKILQPTLTVHEQEGAIQELRFSRDSQQLISVSHDEVVLWDARKHHPAN